MKYGSLLSQKFTQFLNLETEVEIRLELSNLGGTLTKNE
jgi:hypothetical protein